MIAHQWMRVMIVGLLLTVAACTPNAQSQVVTIDSEVFTDAEALAFYVDLSLLDPPQSVQWMQRTLTGSSRSVPGPSDYRIIAVLAYDAPTAAIADQLGLVAGQAAMIEPDLLGDWVPEAVRDAFHPMDSGWMQFDGSAYDAGDLLNAPLTYGSVFFVDRYIMIIGGTT